MAIKIKAFMIFQKFFLRSMSCHLYIGLT